MNENRKLSELSVPIAGAEKVKDLLKLTNPAGKPSYSPNLYKYLRYSLKKHTRAMVRIYTEKDGHLWIGWVGDFNEFIGARLISVLINGSKQQTLCFVQMAHKLTKVEGFWDLYVKYGRCAIDKDHSMIFIGDESRWKLNGETDRECVWCCQHVQRLVETEQVIKSRRWESAERA